MRVMIIEDNEMIRNILKEILEMQGIEAREYENGEKAVGVLRNERFDAVFTDLRMPGLKGVELVETIKNVAPDTPLVVISGSPQDLNEVVVEGKVYRVVKKPFSLESIKDVIASIRRDS